MNETSFSAKSRINTAALLALACSLGVDLAPLMASPSTAKDQSISSDYLKRSANQQKLRADQIKLLQADQDELRANQIKLEEFKRQLSADQIKLKANHIKLEALQMKVEASKQKLEADQHKLSAQQIKGESTAK